MRCPAECPDRSRQLLACALRRIQRTDLFCSLAGAEIDTPNISRRGAHLSIPSYPPTIFVQLEVSKVVPVAVGRVVGGGLHLRLEHATAFSSPVHPPTHPPARPPTHPPTCSPVHPQRAGTDRVMEDVNWLRRNNVKADVIMVRGGGRGRAGRAVVGGGAFDARMQVSCREAPPPFNSDSSLLCPLLRLPLHLPAPPACTPAPPAVAHPHHRADLLQRPLPRHLRRPVAAHRGGAAADRAGGRRWPADGPTQGQLGAFIGLQTIWQ